LRAAETVEAAGVATAAADPAIPRGDCNGAEGGGSVDITLFMLALSVPIAIDDPAALTKENEIVNMHENIKRTTVRRQER